MNSRPVRSMRSSRHKLALAAVALLLLVLSCDNDSIWASDYRTDCLVDSDCVAVTQGDLSQCTCGTNAAINKSDEAKYSAESQDRTDPPADCGHGYFCSGVTAFCHLGVCSACGKGGTCPQDAGVDSGAPPMFGVSRNDAGSLGPNCDPLTPFSPVPWTPPTPFTKACTAQQLADYDACLTNPSGNCSAFRATAANGPCVACLETDINSPAHGPIVTIVTATNVGLGVQVTDTNFGGCIANLDGDKSKTGCGANFDNFDDCSGNDCGNCADARNPSPDGPTASCQKAAFSSGTCSPYSVTGACGQEITADAGVASRCATLPSLFATWCGGA